MMHTRGRIAHLEEESVCSFSALLVLPGMKCRYKESTVQVFLCMCVVYVENKRERGSNGVVWKACEKVEKETVNGNTGIFLKYLDDS